MVIYIIYREINIYNRHQKVINKFNNTFRKLKNNNKGENERT